MLRGSAAASSAAATTAAEVIASELTTNLARIHNGGRIEVRACRKTSSCSKTADMESWHEKNVCYEGSMYESSVVELRRFGDGG